MEVQVINKSSNDLPKYETSGSAGFDLRADFTGKTPENIKGFKFATEMQKDGTAKLIGISINPGGWALIPTNLFTAIPEGYEVQVRSRSGLTIKRGLVVANGIGTIDSDYRDELGIILLNISDEDQIIEPGDRIAQIVLAKYEKLEWRIKEKLSETDRNLGGFGHTGTK